MKLIRKLLNSEYFKNIFIQILGTGIAQLIPFLIMPLLSRIFSKEDFATYTTFMAIVAVLSVVCGGRYQFAIVLPEKKKEAQDIYLVSIYLTVIYAVFLQLIALVFFLLSYEIFNLENTILVIPVYVLFQGLWLSITNLTIRHKKFKKNATAKILQTSSNAISTSSLGFLGVSVGLVIGRLIGIVFSTFFLIKTFPIKSYRLSRFEFKKTVNQYISFPKHTIFPSLLNTFSTQAPVFFISRLYSEEILGYYGFTFLVIAGPLSIISVSFRDVFYQKIAEAYYLKKFTSVYRIFKTNFLILMCLGLPIILILYFFGDSIFSLIFGLEWSQAGIYSSILVFGFVVKFITSPLSVVFNVTNKLEILKKWQIIYFLTTTLTLSFLGYYLKSDIYLFLKIYVLHEIILYLFYLVLQRKVILSTKKRAC